MTVRILVDTNVILYSRDARFPDKRAKCAAWLKALARSKAMVISPQVANEHQRNAQRKLGESQAEAALSTRSLLRWCSRPAGAEDIIRALDIEARWRMNWWDALHIAYAIGDGCTHFLTEDDQGASIIEGVRIVPATTVEPRDILDAA